MAFMYKRIFALFPLTLSFFLRCGENEPVAAPEPETLRYEINRDSFSIDVPPGVKSIKIENNSRNTLVFDPAELKDPTDKVFLSVAMSSSLYLLLLEEAKRKGVSLNDLINSKLGQQETTPKQATP